MLAGEWWARKLSSPASVPYLGCFHYFSGAAFFVSTDWFVEGARLSQCCKGSPASPNSVTDVCGTMGDRVGLLHAQEGPLLALSADQTLGQI